MQLKSYPKYCDGSILRSEDLNSSFCFLYDEIKATRKNLFGRGIVRGLNLSYDKEERKITISQGVAVTASGVVVELDRTMDFYISKKADPITNLEEYILVEKTPDNDLIVEDETEKIIDYIVGLKVTSSESSSSYCSSKSCFSQTDKGFIEVYPLLIGITENSGADGKQNIALKEIELLQKKNFDEVLDYTLLPIFLRRVADYYNTLKGSIERKIGEINERVKDSFSHLFSTQDVTQIQSFDNQKISVYLSFISDLFDAVNEWIVFYNHFLSKYRVLQVTESQEEIIILGKLYANSDKERDIWKDVYQDFGRKKDEELLKRLYERVVDLINSFSPDKEATELSVQPLPSNYNLQDRRIPFYYSDDIKRSWKQSALGSLSEISLSKQIAVYNLNGYEGKRADLFRKEFIKQRTEEKQKASKDVQCHLPVPILIQELDGDEVSFFLEKEPQNIAKEENPVDLDALSKKIYTQKLIDSVSKKDIQKIIKKVIGYYKDHNIVWPLTPLHPYPFDELEKKSLVEEIRQSIYKISRGGNNETITSEEKQVMEVILMFILGYGKEEKDFQPLRLYGANYVRGVEKKDMLLLLTHKRKTLLSISMPYINYVLHQSKYEKQRENIVFPKEKPTFSSVLEKVIIATSGAPVNSESSQSPGSVFSPFPKFDLYMIRYGRNKEHTANYLREHKVKTTFKKAMQMVNNLPILIFEDKTRKQAEQISFVLNERLKANLLIMPSGIGQKDEDDKLIHLACESFDLEVTYFEDTPQNTINMLSEIEGFKDFASLDSSIETGKICIKNLTPEVFLNAIDKLKKIDAVFELIRN